MTETIIQLQGVLNSPDAGLALAYQVLGVLRDQAIAVLDFSQVERATPSFSNAFVMTLLNELDLSTLRNGLRMVNRNDSVVRAINESVSRYQRGLRLTTQQYA